MSYRRTLSLLVVASTFGSFTTVGAQCLQTEDQKVLTGFTSTGDQLGTSVAMDAGTLVIGARFDGEPGFLPGSAFVFDRSTTGPIWGVCLFVKEYRSSALSTDCLSI